MKLTVGQALVKYLSRQYCVHDGERQRLIPATLGIFGHGNVAGLGQALDQYQSEMPFIQGRNRAVARSFGFGIRPRSAAPRHPGRHFVDRPGRHQHGYRCGDGDDQPDPGPPAPK